MIILPGRLLPNQDFFLWFARQKITVSLIPLSVFNDILRLFVFEIFRETVRYKVREML